MNARPLGSPEVRDVPSRPGEAIAVEVVVMPPSANGFNAIVTWIDLFSSCIVASPTVSSPESPLAAETRCKAELPEALPCASTNFRMVGCGMPGARGKGYDKLATCVLRAREIRDSMEGYITWRR